MDGEMLMCAAQIFALEMSIHAQLTPSLEFHSFLFSLSFRKSSSNGHHHHNPVDVSSSPTVAESKARFMREFSEENGSSLGLRDKKVRN